MAKSSSSENAAVAKPLDALLREVRACRICIENPRKTPLPHSPRPVLRVSSTARILIASQAPGIRVHASGMPFTDPSGDRLRAWLGIGPEVFYDESRVAIMPMGFCFPGHDARKADLPPRPECRLAWHDRMMHELPQIETIFVIGAYSRDYHFARMGIALDRNLPLSELVRNWRDYAHLSPRLFPLPHPSWRNSAWLKRNPWFEADVLPAVRAEVARLLALPVRLRPATL